MRLRRAVAMVMSAVVAGSVLVVPPAVAEPAKPPSASPEARAVAKAKETGEPVEITGRTTETSKVTATPGGTFRLETSPVPVRVKQSGGFRDVDLTLERREDGSIGPRRSAADVSFSGGGDDRLTTMAKDGKSLTLTWPGGKLPAPVLDGQSATYVDAGGAGIDLVVKATATGLGTFVVVNTPEAAKNPDLARIEFGVTGDGALLKEQSGEALAAVDGKGEEVFTAPTPTMWEGTKPAGPAGQATGQSPDPDEVSAGPAPGAAEKPMEVEVSAGKLTVVPDQELLKAAGTKWPLTIDPAWEVWSGKREGGEDESWAYVDKAFPNQPYPKPPHLKVGKESEDGTYKQSYVRMDTSGIWSVPGDVKIQNVKLTFDSVHKWACGTHRNVNLHLSRGLWPSTTWNSRPDDFQPLDLPPELALPADGWLAREKVDVAASCGDNDGANDVTFTGANLTKMMQIATDRKWEFALIGIMPQARYPHAGWDDTFNWVKFDNDPRMVVEYGRYPNAPRDLYLTNSGTKKYPCERGAGRPLVTPTNERELHASLTDSSGFSGARLRAHYELHEIGKADEAWPRYYPETGYRLPDPKTGVVAAAIDMVRQDHGGNGGAGTSYGWRVRGEDDTGLAGPWSPYCEFTVDGTPPNVPNVSSDQYPAGKWGGYDPAGRRYRDGWFRFDPNGSMDVVKFHYWFDGEGFQTKGATAGQPVDVPITPRSFGLKTLNVQAEDRAGHKSGARRYVFGVEQPPRDAGWSMDEPSGSTARAIAGTGMLRPGANITFHGGATTGQPGNLSGANSTDRAVRFNGSGQFGEVAPMIDVDAQQLPLVDTSKRFMFSTWVKLASTSGYQIAMSQQAADGSVFEIGWMGSRWGIRHRKPGEQDVVVVRQQEKPSDGSEWTQHWVSLMGGYDPISKELWLRTQAPDTGGGVVKVMDPEVASRPDIWSPSPGQSQGKGPLLFGAAVKDADKGFFLDGWVDDSQVWPLAHPDEKTLNVVYGETVQDQPFAGQVRRVVNPGSGHCLDVPGGSTANDAEVRQWTCNAGPTQNWTFTDVGGGYYTLTSPYSGKCLNVAGASSADGANVIQYDCVGGAANEMWRPVPVPGGYRLEAKHSEKCLDVVGGSSDWGADTQQHTCNGSDAQLWSITSQKRHEFDGVGYRLKSGSDGQCLEVASGSQENNGTVGQWPCEDKPWHQWRFDATGDGSYTVTNVNSGKCLDVPGGSTAAGVRVDQWDCVVGADNEKWMLVPVDNDGTRGYRLIAKHSGLVLGVDPDGRHVIQDVPQENREAPEYLRQIWKLDCLPGSAWRCSG